MTNSLQFAFPSNGKSAVFKPEMSSLRSETDEEDFISDATHIKFKEEDTADHSLSEPESFIEKRKRQAGSPTSACDRGVLSLPPCVKSIKKWVTGGTVYTEYDCKMHSMTACSSTAPVFNRCKPVKQYIAGINRILVTNCVCVS